MNRLCITAGLSALVLGGCVAGNAPPTAGGRRVSYACAGAPGMTVIYGGDMARIETGSGQTLLLQRRETNDGFWYESASHRLRGKGNMVTFAKAWTPLRRCHTS